MKLVTALLLFVACALALVSVACGGSSAHTNAATTPVATSGSNVQAISVNSGVDANYANGIFTSVTVCAPGSTSCQTIDNVLVDTGSSGLRILSTALTVSLAQQTSTDGNPVAECLPFVSGFTWGPVETADVQISGETAASLPVQVIGESAFAVPAACSSQGAAMDTVTALGANGILGIGVFAQDCGGACTLTGASNPGLYYQCPSAGCAAISESLSQQVQNPVALFAQDNNGVIIELPAASAPEPSLTGSLVFGIGTQSNNGLGSASIYNVDDFGNFITSYKNVAYNQSFIDSGSNGLFFLTSSLTGIVACSGGDFYCPPTTQSLSAVTEGATNATSGTIDFSVANADNLFNNNPSAFVFPALAGPNSISGFDWGLPFFYGRNVFTAIQGQSTPGGSGPYWAY
ncbi:MAG TPA: DUF3443 domain-containing protein [Candidatus Sulfotelmatobacter sp.]|jgi:hypothetical protein